VNFTASCKRFFSLGKKCHRLQRSTAQSFLHDSRELCCKIYAATQQIITRAQLKATFIFYALCSNQSERADFARLSQLCARYSPLFSSHKVCRCRKNQLLEEIVVCGGNRSQQKAPEMRIREVEVESSSQVRPFCL
jgi:hypothetical protein